MLRVSVERIQPGMRLARPIRMPNDPRMILLQADREIPLTLVSRLSKLGIGHVWVRHAATEYLEDLIVEGLGERQQDVYTNIRQCYEHSMRSTSGSFRFDVFDGCVEEFTKFLRGNSNCRILLEKLDAFDNYLLSHSSNVCYLALLLGLRLDRYLIQQRPMKSPGEAKDVHYLGLGCLLHDIGKLHVPKEVLDKPARLNEEEYRAIRQHTIAGYEMLRNKVPSLASQIALNHHQRWDGTGYPTRQEMGGSDQLTAPAGNQIHIFSRIAAVADVYDALTTDRCYSRAKTPVEALAMIEADEKGHFDPIVKQALMEVTPAFSLGQVVGLSNGCEAVVMSFDAKQPTRPTVRCIVSPQGVPLQGPACEELDLRRAVDDVRIESVEGCDVRKAIAVLESAMENKARQPALTA